MKNLKLIAITAVCCVIFACKQSNKNSASTSGSVQTPGKPEVSNNGVRIDYLDTGAGDTTLLLVHGWALNKSYFSSQIKHFSDKYRVVAIDLPGFGNSGKNRKQWTTRTYASDINAVVDQLGLKNVVVVGHSMAGDIILEAAVQRPKNYIAIVGVDNFKGIAWVPNEKDKKSLEDAVKQMRTHFKSFATSYFNQELFSKNTPKPIKDRILNEVANADSVIATEAMAQGSYYELPNLKQYGRKLYLINSDYQPTDVAAMAKNKVPYKLMSIHGTGHFPMVEAPDEFNKDLEKILADIKK